MSEIETGSPEPEFAAFVGTDWADQKHVWCLQARETSKRESEELANTPEAVEAWVAQLCQRFGNRVCALLERWPTLEELQKVPPAKLLTFLGKHHCRNQELIERRMLAIRQAIPAIRDRAVIEAKECGRESDCAAHPNFARRHCRFG